MDSKMTIMVSIDWTVPNPAINVVATPRYFYDYVESVAIRSCREVWDDTAMSTMGKRGAFRSAFSRAEFEAAVDSLVAKYPGADTSEVAHARGRFAWVDEARP